MSGQLDTPATIIVGLNEVVDRTTAETAFPEQGIRAVSAGAQSELAYVPIGGGRVYFPSQDKLTASGGSFIGVSAPSVTATNLNAALEELAQNTGGGGQVDSVTSSVTNYIDVNNVDPANPVIVLGPGLVTTDTTQTITGTKTFTSNITVGPILTLAGGGALGSITLNSTKTNISSINNSGLTIDNLTSSGGASSVLLSTTGSLQAGSPAQNLVDIYLDPQVDKGTDYTGLKGVAVDKGDFNRLVEYDIPTTPTNYVTTNTTQTITGAKTFSNNVILSGTIGNISWNKATDTLNINGQIVDFTGAFNVSSGSGFLWKNSGGSVVGSISESANDFTISSFLGKLSLNGVGIDLDAGANDIDLRSAVLLNSAIDTGSSYGSGKMVYMDPSANNELKVGNIPSSSGPQDLDSVLTQGNTSTLGATFGADVTINDGNFLVEKTLGYGSSFNKAIRLGASNDTSVNVGESYKWDYYVSGDENGQDLSFRKWVRGGGQQEVLKLDSDSNATFSGNIIGRKKPRITTVTSVATALSVNGDTHDQYNITNQANAFTINAPTGTPVDGQKLIYRISGNGSGAWNITWINHTAVGVTLPMTTINNPNKVLYVGCIYNSNQSRWDVIAVAEEV